MAFFLINSDIILICGLKFKMFPLFTFSLIFLAQGEQFTDRSTEQEVSLWMQNSVSSGSLVLVKAANIE